VVLQNSTIRSSVGNWLNQMSCNRATLRNRTRKIIETHHQSRLQILEEVVHLFSKRKVRRRSGGWATSPTMGMSIGVTFSTGRGVHIYGEKQVDEPPQEFAARRSGGGFNILRFRLRSVARLHDI